MASTNTEGRGVQELPGTGGGCLLLCASWGHCSPGAGGRAGIWHRRGRCRRGGGGRCRGQHERRRGADGGAISKGSQRTAEAARRERHEQLGGRGGAGEKTTQRRERAGDAERGGRGDVGIAIAEEGALIGIGQRHGLEGAAAQARPHLGDDTRQRRYGSAGDGDPPGAI